MKSIFVILHYLTIIDTIECIQSILNNVEGDFDIVVVDNGSNDGSGLELEAKYRGVQNIHIIISKTNSGFARGNNIGYQYAKQRLNPDFIILLNNDTLVTQKHFIEIIEKKYIQHEFDILGPDIHSLVDNTHQNPHNKPLKEYSKSYLLALFIKFLASFLLIYLKVDSVFKRKKRNTSMSEHKIYNMEQKDIMLHGCCLIFSRHYINKYNGLYDKTFLYMEEDILFYIAQKEGLLTMYSPDIFIEHKEDSSTNAFVKVGRQKRLFIYKHHLKSSLEFLKIVYNNNLYKSRIIAKKHIDTVFKSGGSD
jgi:GT2 family glycosyltransferase